MRAKTQHNVPLAVSLPPLRNVSALTTQQISRALHILRDAICPLLPLAIKAIGSPNDEILDSGYVSADQDDFSGDAHQELDGFDRAFAEKWLTGFIGRASELTLADTENLTEIACSILTHLTGGDEDEDDEDGGEDKGFMRRFEFELGTESPQKQILSVELHDTPMQMGRDHTDVGLQTWGASIVLSRLMARRPEAFGLSNGNFQPGTRIVEMGAGTGLLSLVLSSLLGDSQPLIVATDYHPTVLANLERNAQTHAARSDHSRAAPIEVCHLDWSAPRRDAPLDIPAKIIVAADVAYAPEHAAWLRDCAAELLAADGVFWLMVSIRPNGKFEGISDVVEAAFEVGSRRSYDGGGVGGKESDGDGRVLRIVSTERLHKLDGIGRADEVAYKLYKVMWQPNTDR